MASRIAARFVSRRLSSSGKMFSEEEKAAENIYIKKTEQEKLAKLARKGPKPEEVAGSSAAAAAAETKVAAETASAGAGASTEKISTDKHRNYAVIAGVVTMFGALGWYIKGTEKKPEVQED